MSSVGKRLCWLVPDDRGGGVVSVVLSCCRRAKASGGDPTLLLMLSATGHIAEHVDFRLCSLDVPAPYLDAPERMVRWLLQNPQDVLFLNGCEQADSIIPFVPSGIRCVYVVHDPAPRYWKTALRYEDDLDAIVTVSYAVADEFRQRLRHPEKLHVVHNGTLFPEIDNRSPQAVSPADLMFLGGDQPGKGAYDVLGLWPQLVKKGFSGRLHWFGRVTQAFSAKIEELPCSDQIVSHGRVVRSEIFNQAAESRVILMLSRVESFGMATVECMGMGCLPVAWDIKTGTREIVEKDHPFFAPLGDIAKLADLVVKACDRQPQLRSRLIERARVVFGEVEMWNRYVAMTDRLSAQAPVHRALAGQKPPAYHPPLRLFQLLPDDLRAAVRECVGRSAYLGYLLRRLRGV